MYSFTPPFWSLPTAFLRGTAAAAGIAFINSVGNLGGFTGPYLMGWLQDASGDFRTGLRVLAVAAVISSVLVLTGRVKGAQGDRGDRGEKSQGDQGDRGENYREIREIGEQKQIRNSLISPTSL